MKFSRDIENHGEICSDESEMVPEKNEVQRGRVNIFLRGKYLPGFGRTATAVETSLHMFPVPRRGSDCFMHFVCKQMQIYSKNPRPMSERTSGRVHMQRVALFHSRRCYCNAIQSLVTARQQLFGCTILFAKQSATIGWRFV